MRQVQHNEGKEATVGILKVFWHVLEKFSFNFYVHNNIVMNFWLSSLSVNNIL